MSLIDAAERFAALDRSAVMLDTRQCLHTHGRHAACEACFAICPCEAITPGKPPSLDSAKCKDCLACLPACPTGAFSADDAVPALMRLAPNLEQHSLELACARNPASASGTSEQGPVVTVKGCLAGIGTGAYMALAALGLEHITVRVEACAGCEWAHVLPQIETQVRHAQQMLAAWGRSDVVSISAEPGTHVLPVWTADNPPLSRRDLFRMMAHQGQVAIARAMENGERATGRRPGRDRIRMVGAVTHLPAPEAEPGLELRELGYASVTVSEACSACGACAKACPTQALTFEKDEDSTRFALKFTAGACVACGLCAHVCLPDALRMGEPAPLAGTFQPAAQTLQEGELVKCKRCGAMIARRGERELCDVCDYRRLHPFGSKMPPGMQPAGDNRQ